MPKYVDDKTIQETITKLTISENHLSKLKDDMQKMFKDMSPEERREFIKFIEEAYPQAKEMFE